MENNTNKNTETIPTKEKGSFAIVMPKYGIRFVKSKLGISAIKKEIPYPKTKNIKIIRLP